MRRPCALARPCFAQHAIGVAHGRLRRKLKGSTGSARQRRLETSSPLPTGLSPGQRRVVSVGDTLLYRHLATTQVTGVDVAVGAWRHPWQGPRCAWAQGGSLTVPSARAADMGCSYGATTALLATRARRAIGIDIGRDCVEQCRAAHPGARPSGNKPT